MAKVVKKGRGEKKGASGREGGNPGREGGEGGNPSSG
jgi:hypothetical protein